MEQNVTASAMSLSLLARNVYCVCFTDRDSSETLRGELAQAREKFFSGNRKTVRVDSRERIRGFQGKLQGKLSRRTFFWRKSAAHVTGQGRLMLEEAFDQRGGYVLVTRDFRGVIASRVFFDKTLLWLKSEYYEPWDNHTARVTFKPVDADDRIERFDWDSAKMRSRSTMLYPVPYQEGSPQQNLLNARFGEPKLLVSTKEGVFCYCPEKEAQARKDAAEELKSGTLIMLPAWEVKEGTLTVAEDPEETDISFPSMEEYALIHSKETSPAQAPEEPAPAAQAEAAPVPEEAAPATQAEAASVSEEPAPAPQTEAAPVPEKTDPASQAEAAPVPEEPASASQAEAATVPEEPAPAAQAETAPVSEEPAPAAQAEAESKLEETAPAAQAEAASVSEESASASHAEAATVSEESAPAAQAEAATVSEEFAPTTQAETAPVSEEPAPATQAEAAPAPEEPASAAQAETAPVPEETAPAAQAEAAPASDAISQLSVEKILQAARELAAKGYRIPGNPHDPQDPVSRAILYAAREAAKVWQAQEADTSQEPAKAPAQQQPETASPSPESAAAPAIHGRAQQPDGITVYEGQFREGRRDGFGVAFYKDGTPSYTGSWKAGKRDGLGVSFRDGDHAVHISRWKDGTPQDFVSLFDKEGNLRYGGRIEKGKKQGPGVSYNTADGTVFVGKWVDGRPTGVGSAFDREGNLVYYGEWKNGQRCGHGTQFDSSGGIVFDGEWKDGKYYNGILYQKLENPEEDKR